MVAPPPTRAIVGAFDRKVEAILALLLSILGTWPAPDAAAVAQVTRLRDALKLLWSFWPRRRRGIERVSHDSHGLEISYFEGTAQGAVLLR